MCVQRVVDESYEEYSTQFTEDPEQQFVEEGKCPWSYVLLTLNSPPFNQFTAPIKDFLATLSIMKPLGKGCDV